MQVFQKTENCPGQGDMVKVFIGDSLLKMVIKGEAPMDPNKRIDFFVKPGGKLKDLDEMLRYVKHYYHSINISVHQLSILVALGYNDHRSYGGAIDEFKKCVTRTDVKLAFIPPPVPREKKLAMNFTEYKQLLESHKKLVDVLINFNMENRVKFKCDLYRTSIKTRSKSHFASDNYHFSSEKSAHILNHIRIVFSRNDVFDV
jgi:hypothetical protein